MIQPQPRSAVASAAAPAEVQTGKPAWRPTPRTASGMSSNADFPTAAEVARVEASQLQDKKDAALAEAAKQEALQHEADAFRGVHLDPKAHHWDEMAEDGDDFLDGVIEFEDGKQYTVKQAVTTTDDANAQKGRFVDDFDRSWPRSNGQTSNLSTQRDLPPHSDKPLDSPRTLYNEHSGRLEHISPTATSTNGPGFHGRRRGDSRGESSRPVQLLQKSGGGGGAHESPSVPFRAPRGFRTPSGREMPPSSVDSGGAGRGQGRDPPPHGGPLRSPTFDSAGPGMNNRGRRLSNMGPPPLPLTSPGMRHRDLDRQAPPHLSPMQQYQQPMRPPSSARGTSRESVSRNALQGEDPGLPLRSPRLSLRSPRADALASLPPEVDMSELTKDAMHSAAQRAKLRRQQEEEERERERERARKKAEELEAKFGPGRFAKKEDGAKSPLISSSEVLSVIESAIKEATTGSSTLPPSTEKPSLSRPPSQRPTQRPPLGSSSADEAGSWRRKSATPAIPTQSSQPTTSPTSARQPPLEFQAPVLTVQPGEEVEEIDFSDHGKLVDERKQPRLEAPPHPRLELPVKPPRPTAEDFFEEAAPSRLGTRTAPAAESNSWRRRQSTEAGSAPPADEPPAPVPKTPSDLHSDHGRTFLPSRPSGNGTQQHVHQGAPGHGGPPRSPRQQTFREASMTALDDTLLRIRGAINHMHENNDRTPVKDTPEPAKPPEVPPPKETVTPKWIPPARRQPQPATQTAEAFDVTARPPPRSPKPEFKVHLPEVSTTLEPIPKKKLQKSEAPAAPMRWDILSFNPPVQGMSSKDLSVNNVLFNQVPVVNGKPSIKVELPSAAATKAVVLSRATDSAVAVKLPTRPQQPMQIGWNSDETSSSNKLIIANGTSDIGLETVSRSPPPEVTIPERKLSVSSAASKANVNGVALSAEAQAQSSNAPTQKAVTFTVASEIPISEPPARLPTTSGQVALIEAPPTSSSSVTAPANTVMATAAGGKASTTTSPSREKARLPDPDFLKAVWSHVPEKSNVPTSNSLKNIADDLNAVPFTLQEVKSDDGTGTPPPVAASATPSKMSLSDVTRAFQQVPTQSHGSASSTPPAAPPPAGPQITRRPSYGYVQQPPGHVPGRPPVPYPSYPPPVMGSPAPTVVYPSNMAPSPAMRPMQLGGQPGPYQHAVWVPAGNMHPPGTSNGIGRGLPGGYPTQMLAYPTTPGVMQPVYHPSQLAMMHVPQTPDDLGRGRGMPLVSPVMPNSAFAAPSPVLVHAPGYAPPPMGTPGRPPVPLMPHGMPTASPRIPPAMPYGQHPSASPYARPW